MVEAILANLGEELAVSLLSSEETEQENACTVYGEQSADRVEFRCEDLENDQREGELAQRGSNVGTFKGSLGCSNLYEFLIVHQNRALSIML